MWIIIEGVDGVGKSLLCERLIEKIDGDAIGTHLGRPSSPDKALSECIDDEPFSTYTPGEGVHLVSDRHHWGCPVYGPVKRPDDDREGYGELGRAGWRYAEMFVASRGGTTFFMDADVSTIVERMLARGDDYVETSEIPALVDRYRWLAGDSLTLEYRIWQPDMDELDGVAKAIVSVARSREAEASAVSQYADYIGGDRPDVLVLCEPYRETRLEIVDRLSDEQWQSVGMCSYGRTRDTLDRLHAVLHHPRVIGVGDLPGDADQFVHVASGTIVKDVADIERIV